MIFKFDPSKLGSEIGKGENGIIHEYKDQGSEKSDHVVKCIKVDNFEKIMSFIEEFFLGCNNNPFVLDYKSMNIHQYNQDGYKCQIYILMKAQKQNMKEFIRKRNKDGKKDYLPLDEIISIFFSLANALAYLEEREIVHSNITHDSVLFDKNDTVKLGGFAFSMYKPWKIPQKKIYQSYRPPEIILKKANSNSKEEKNGAFKSDVWCLGKFIVDICLLQDELVWENSVAKARDKVKVDLKKVEEIYPDQTFVQILGSLLKSSRKERPTFQEICKVLQKAYSNCIELLVMKNSKKKEESNLNISLSSIHSEEEIHLDTTFQEKLWQNIEEKKEELKKAVQYTQQDVQKMIKNFQALSSESYNAIKERVKLIQTDLSQISGKSIDKFLQEAKEYLSAFKEHFNKLKPQYQELKTALEKVSSPSEETISKQMAPPENASAILEQGMPGVFQQEVDLLQPLPMNTSYCGVTGKSDSFFDPNPKDKDPPEKEDESLKE